MKNRHAFRQAYAKEVTKYGLVNDDARKMAGAWVDEAMRLFVLRCEAERTMLYRLKMRSSVRLASRILVDAARVEGIDLGELANLMSPPPYWPEEPGLTRWPQLDALLLEKRATKKAGRSNADRFLERRFARGGVVVRAPGEDGGAFVVDVVGDVLSACMDLGPCRLVLGTRSAKLRLPSGLPETVLLGAIGRPLDQVVEHSLFTGRDYKILDVVRLPRCGSAVLIIQDDLMQIDLMRPSEAPGSSDTGDGAFRP